MAATTPPVGPRSLALAGLSQNCEGRAGNLRAPAPSRWDVFNRVLSILQSRIEEETESVLLSLGRTIAEENPATDGHSGRFIEYAVGLGKRLGLPEEDLNALRVGSVLHDIGKIAVPEDILSKRGSLTPGEETIIRQHPLVGEAICAQFQCLRSVLPIIRHHHERIDGSGYPDGLKGSAIPLAARIIHVVDVYDALTTDRSYRDALRPHRALGTLHEEVSLGWLDRGLVAHFSQLLKDYSPISVPAQRGNTRKTTLQNQCARVQFLPAAAWRPRTFVAGPVFSH